MEVGVSITAAATAVTGAPAPSPGNLTSLTIDPTTSGKVHQRVDDQTYADIPMSGTYLGTPGQIQVGLFNTNDDSQIGGWQNVSAENDVWTGTIRVPAARHSYYRKVQHVGQPEVDQTDSTPFFAGDNWMIYGQSNGIRMKSNGDAQAALEGARHYDGATDSWLDITAKTGLYEFTKRVMTHTGYACGIIGGGKSGTSLAGLAEGTDTFNELAGWVAAMDADIRGCAMIHGESDADSNGDPLDYIDLMADVHASVATIVGRTVDDFAWLISGLGTFTGGGYDEYGFTRIDHALRDCETFLNGEAFYAGSRRILPLSDTIHHPIGATGTGIVGSWIGEMAAWHMGALAARPSFKIASAARVSTTQTSVSLEHGLGTDFTPTTGITGFEISDDGGATWQTASGVRSSATVITLTHAAVNADRMRTIRYQHGGYNLNDETVGTGPVVDNSALQIPLWPDMGFGTVVAPGATSVPWARFLGSRSVVGHLQQASQTDHTSLPFHMPDGLTSTEEMLVVFFYSHQGNRVLASNTNGDAVVFNLDAGQATEVTIHENTAGAETTNVHLITAKIPSGTSSFTVTTRTGTQVQGAGRAAAFALPTSLLTNASTPVDSVFAEADEALSVSASLTTVADALILAGFVTRERYVDLGFTATNGALAVLWADEEQSGEDHGAAGAISAQAGTTTVTGTADSAGDMSIAAIALR
ncbi:MAG: hypothetical protein AAF830_09250 [Pseudomonadota bacterium]